MIRIGPRLKTFAWGQAEAIPRLLGTDPIAGPVAEAWFGAHESAPSPLPDGSDLAAFVAADPRATVGADRLPYLLKVLAIASPLSIQVHPTRQQAKEGFDAEERAHVDVGAPARTFPDPRHKPELVVALTPMRVLVGLREPADLARDLSALGADELLACAQGTESLLTYVMAALGNGTHAAILDRLCHVPDGDSALALAGRAARAFPGDPGALVALAMNPIVLQPGQGCYVPPRVIHSYQSGIGIEIMANSDNVVRGGLTPKAVDVTHLGAILDATPHPPHRPTVSRDGAVTTYSVPTDDFELVRLEAGAASLSAAPHIVLALDSAEVTTASDVLTLARGQAAFVPLSDGVVTVRTDGLVFVARPGGSAAHQ